MNPKINFEAFLRALGPFNIIRGFSDLKSEPKYDALYFAKSTMNRWDNELLNCEPLCSCSTLVCFEFDADTEALIRAITEVHKMRMLGDFTDEGIVVYCFPARQVLS